MYGAAKFSSVAGFADTSAVLRITNGRYVYEFVLCETNCSRQNRFDNRPKNRFGKLQRRHPQDRYVGVKRTGAKRATCLFVWTASSR